MMEDAKYLVVMSDDFAMCPAINEGIAQAFADGLLTDTNIMAPCPSLVQAITLTKAHDIPVGLHATFVCEWDLYRWGPVTAMKSMVTSEGYFRNRVEAAWATADEEEAMTELRAQASAIESEGIRLTHIGEHVGLDKEGKFEKLMRRFSVEKNLPHRGIWANYAGRNIAHYEFTSVMRTSATSTDRHEAKSMLKKKLFALKPGYHQWVCHAALDHPSLDKLCSQHSKTANWARTYRAIDQFLLMDAEVKEWIEQLDIRLVSVSQCPISRS